MELREASEVIGDYTGNARKALEYGLIMKRLVDQAKAPGFSVESWAPLAELIAVDEFERVGNFKEVMTWAECVNFLTVWAASANWEYSFKRITERPGVVFLELEERSRVGEQVSAVNSLSVYEFNDAGKIRHLDIYLQWPLPNPEMLASYEGIRISE
ncbi:conserved hypothetical protein [Parafrankia sp. EAN1pec]|uniref:hypothetical protein n=1 Tax=Parafrankia sp. (strain EAN1pec) TaxID=298653 RepID=UPI00005410BD|nr:conserved hypothetical protein [Frankia sp. EAN1pec]